MPLAIHRMYRTSTQEIQPSRLASGSHTKPSSTVTKAAMKLHPAAGTANKLDSGATSTKMRKYQAVSGAVNTTALRVADRFAATKHSAVRSGRHLPLYHPVSSLYSRGDSSTIPSVAEKLSCKLTLAAAKGLHSRITSSAAAKLVRGSLPRRNSGAISRNICMMQARTTEGLMPTITM